MTANYHTHTPRCGHARGGERACIEHAIRAGLKTLGFADHAPYPFPNGFISGMRMAVDETEDYVSTILRLKKEYERDITVLVGYEMEYFPACFSLALRNVCDYPIDYLIMGQHFLGNEYDGAYAGARTTDPAALTTYVDLVITGLSTDAFSYLAHPDLPNFAGDAAHYEAEMTRLCTYAKAHDIPLELNFLGLKEHRQYPCDRFWRIAAEIGCTAIYGCDAHTPEMLSDKDIRHDAKAYAARFGLTVTDTLSLRDPRKACTNATKISTEI